MKIKKSTYKNFLSQINYLNKKKNLKAGDIRKILSLSYSKNVIPSRNVRICILLIFNNKYFNFLKFFFIVN